MKITNMRLFFLSVKINQINFEKLLSILIQKTDKHVLIFINLSPINNKLKLKISELLNY